MNDLIERLRAHPCFFQNGGIWLMGTSPDGDCQDAANEIERLRAALERIAGANITQQVGDLDVKAVAIRALKDNQQ